MAELSMDIEGSPLQFSSAGTRPRRVYTFRKLATAQRASSTFSHCNKSESARKLRRLEVGREFELDERLFIVLIGRVMELLETY
jgi:hypothetical protein